MTTTICEEQKFMPRLERVNCLLCGSDECRLLCTHTNDRYFALLDLHEPVRVVMCARCGAVYANPRLTEESLRELYQKQYRGNVFFSSKEKIEYYSKCTFRRVQKHFDFVWPRIKGYYKNRTLPRVVDIGCAMGNLLSLFKEKGCDVSGLEPTEGFIPLAQEYFGITIHQGFIEDGAALFQDIDLVLLTDVIEHLADPLAALKTIGSIVKENGFFYVCVSDIATPKGDPTDLFGGPHLHFFTPEVLSELFKRAGFSMVDFISSEGKIRMLARKDHAQQSVQGLTRVKPYFFWKIKGKIELHKILYYMKCSCRRNIAAVIKKMIGKKGVDLVRRLKN